MLLEEFDMDEYIKMERRDSYEDGHEDGLAMGLAEGKRLEQLHIIHNMFQENIPAQSCARDFALKNKSPCSACEFQAKQGISILGIKLLFFSV